MLKLLDASIIYPISDSRWVSLVHVVPKKLGIIVVKSNKGELANKDDNRVEDVHRLSKIELGHEK